VFILRHCHFVFVERIVQLFSEFFEVGTCLWKEKAIYNDGKLVVTYIS